MERLENKIGFYKYQPAQNESKGVIVFIHGFATTSDYHDDAAEKFNDYDYYTFELPGHGYTKIDGLINSKKWDLSIFSNFCISMIEELGLQDVILIGHSMGGAISIAVANQLKEKIIKLILVTPMNSSINYQQIGLYFLFNPKTFNKTLALNNVLYKDLTKTLELDIDNYISKEHIYQVENIDFFKKLKHKMYSLKNVKSCIKNEKQLITPTLLIVGEFDKTTPYKNAIRAIKKSNKLFIQVVVFHNSAHLPFKEEKEKYFKDIHDFIE